MSPTINRDLRGTLPYCTSPIPDVGTKYLQLTYRTPFDGIFVTIAPWLDESNRQTVECCHCQVRGKGEM